MSRKDKFLRQCCACGKFLSKDELIRVTKDFKTGDAVINNSNEFNGRSVYICKNTKCVEEALKKKRIEHRLNVFLPEETKTELHNCT